MGQHGRAARSLEREIAGRLARPVVTVVGATEPHKCQAIAAPRGSSAPPSHRSSDRALHSGPCWKERSAAGSIHPGVRSRPDLGVSPRVAHRRRARGAIPLVLARDAAEPGRGFRVARARGVRTRGARAALRARCSFRGPPQRRCRLRDPRGLRGRAIDLLEVQAYQRGCIAALSSAARHDWAHFAASWQRVVRGAGI